MSDIRRVVLTVKDGAISARYFAMSLSSESVPRSVCRMMSADVHCLVIEPMRKAVAGADGWFVSRLA